MIIAIRIEPNGEIYIDKHLRDDIPYTEPPYNFTIINIDNKYANCINTDFDNDFTLNIERYNKRIHDIQVAPRIRELKQLLADTDYKAIKYAEGEITAEEYEPIKLQRREWRKEINELEKNV